MTTYRLTDEGKLVPLDTKPSPGAACWNVFTNNGKFLYVTNPLGKLVSASNVHSSPMSNLAPPVVVDRHH